MLILCAVAGWMIGCWLNWAVDYLPRFAGEPSARHRVVVHPRLTSALVDALRLAFATTLDKSARRKPTWLNLAVEISSMLLVVCMWLRWGTSTDFFLRASVGIFLVLLAVIDLKYRLVLNVTIFPAMALAVLMHLAWLGTNWLAVFIGGAFGFAIFSLVAFLRPGELGSGDVKLATLIGLFFGFPNAVWALSVAVFAGGIGVIFMLFIQRADLSTRIPYAPFLCLGALSMLAFNPFLNFH